MIKSIGYRIFALVYYICKLLPIHNKRILCIHTHDDGEGSNATLAVKALIEQNNGYTFSYITKKDTMEVKGFKNLPKMLSFFFQKPYLLARAQVVLMDNTFLPFAYLKRRKGVKVIQLWHGTGTFKRFGQDANTGRLKELEQIANRNITHLIVNSPETKKLYAQTFGINERYVYPIGLPKTDDLIRRVEAEEKSDLHPDKNSIYHRYSIPKDRKLILYAPTFRDDEPHNPEVLVKLLELIKGLPEEYYLGLRLHPFIARTCEGVKLPSRAIQLSFEPDLSAVLMASDLLITDYSSIAFEYCITERPMVFFAYDLEEFSDHGRGFYEDYTSYVPGPVAYTSEEVIAIIRDDRIDLRRIQNFKNRNFSYLDGNATGRLIELIEK
ncbi:MAG TPA: CDP-glycerol glycerophosphotransferase family protein [Mobilitalea sp.]|nr:CDP-glycerol glycerophosphotransferase family protein [Mobilitalea sp.]